MSAPGAAAGTAAGTSGVGVLRSTDRLLPGSGSTVLGKSALKKGVTFNLKDNEDDDDDDADDDNYDDESISPPMRDMCRYCTVSCFKACTLSPVYTIKQTSSMHEA